MPQLRGSCGHVKGEWDSHYSCMSCTGCSPSSKCSFCQKGGGDVSAASISRWVASTIKKAYSSLSSKDLSFLKIRPHELRALSASWAFVNHTPLSDVLQAAFWRNPTTFSSFYLRSFEHQQDNLYLFGPLVVAQTVVSSTT